MDHPNGSSGNKSGARRPVRTMPFGELLRYLSTFRTLQRNVWLFLGVTACRGMVVATLGTILNLYLYSLGYDTRFIGIINAANSVAVLLVSVPLGYAADRFGRKPVMLIGGILYPLSILGLSVASSTPLIMAFNFMFGAVAAAYWTAGIPLLVASTTERDRVQAFSLNSFLLWGFGPFGAFLSGQVVELAGGFLHVSASATPALRVGMLFMAVLGFIGAVPYIFLREPPREKALADSPPAHRKTAWLFAQLLIPDVILAFGLGAILTFSQLYFHLRFGLDPGPIGLLVAVGGVLAGGGTLLVPLVASRWGNLRTAVWLQWLATPLMAAMALAMQLVVAVPAFWLVLSLRGMSDPVYTAFVQERVPEVYRARLTGFYSVTYSIGYSLGPAVSGQIQKTSGFTLAFLMATGCYFVGALLLYLFFARGDRPVGGAMTRAAT